MGAAARQLATVTHIRGSAPPAAPEVIEHLAAELTDGALQCREHRRHAWRPHTVKRRRWGFERVEVCEDCGSERRQDLDRSALVVRQYVHYSDGYLLPPGSGRVDQAGAAQFRLVSLLRQLEH